MAKVTLIGHTPQPEKTIAAAAKLCYSPATIDTVLDKLDEQNTAQFIDMLASLGHESPMEHVSFTFGIEGVSRAFLAQITRHRIASYSVQSQRYVREKEMEYVTPPEIAGDEAALLLFEEAMDTATQYYQKLTAILLQKHKKELMDSGMEEKAATRAAEKKAIEDARFVLPNACDTKMIVTMNARSLFNFFHHRCCTRAQWEIRDVADEMLRLVKEVAPTLFKQSGPPCVQGPCPEGKMTCGRQQEMRKRYLEQR